MLKSPFNTLDSGQGPYTAQKALAARSQQIRMYRIIWRLVLQCIDPFYTQSYIQKVQYQIMQTEMDLRLLHSLGYVA